MNIIGTMRAVDETRGAVRVEDVYDTDIDDLWEACTTPERLARWIAEVSGDLRVGGMIHAVFTSTWTGPGRVEVCDAPHHLLLTMEPGGRRIWRAWGGRWQRTLRPTRSAGRSRLRHRRGARAGTSSPRRTSQW
ncbi:MAG TPA: SRPBCC domain-containing protein [Nocardioides sp.]|nr:SRPBCC domain-containing protein [Nocardioides sp.]